MRLRVTQRAATQIEKALDYIEADSPIALVALHVGYTMTSAAFGA